MARMTSALTKPQPTDTAEITAARERLAGSIYEVNAMLGGTLAVDEDTKALKALLEQQRLDAIPDDSDEERRGIARLKGRI